MSAIHSLLRWPPSRYGTVRRAVSRLIRNRPLLNRAPPPGAYVNIGPGEHISGGMYHIDYFWRPGIDLCWDLECGRLPFKDASVGGIFTEHCMEHTSIENFLRLAAEFWRVLMPGRTARIVVPDGELYARRYLSGLPSTNPAEPRPPMAYTPFWSVNHVFYSHGHRFMYDFETMRAALAYVGFTGIDRCEFGKGRDASLLVDRPDRAHDSLYVEATKHLL